jgi:predicted acylesterase/phospholipase RssA
MSDDSSTTTSETARSSGPVSATPASSPEPVLVNGVFKGGGAKGIAYVGALSAMRDRGLWFGSVAGASAGAIFSALIASGMRPEELADALPEALATVQSPIPVRIGKAVIGHANTVFDSADFRRWLDRRLARKIGKEGTAPVSFAELFAASGIELYVVAMDLATGIPIVFNRRTTPDVEVAGAVAASSAIPGALPPGRAVFPTPGDGAVVHQLVDGGTWANFPSFVFLDRSFRAWVNGEARRTRAWTADDDRGWQDESQRPLVGFVLGKPEAHEPEQPIGMVPVDGAAIDRRFDQGPTYTSGKPVPYLFGATLSSDWARLIIGASLVVWAALSMATLPIGARRFSSWLAGWSPDPFYPLLLVGVLSAVTIAAVVALVVSVVLVLAGRLIADTLIPSFDALMGVPTGVAPWIGQGDDSVVVRVPYDGLKTMDFSPGPALRSAAIDAAREFVGAQLDDPNTRRRLDSMRGLPVATPPLAAAPESMEGGRAAGQDRQDDAAPGRSTMRTTGVVAGAVGATIAIAVLARWAVSAASGDRLGSAMLALLVAVGVGGAALVFLGTRAGARAHLRSRFGATTGPARSNRLAYGLIAAGVGAVIGGCVLAAVFMHHDPSATRVVEVTSATVTADSNRYEATEVDDATVSVWFTSDRHLRLGEHVFVADDDDADSGVGLTGSLARGRFVWSIALSLLGFGLITSGVRLRNWNRRCTNLAALWNSW